MSEKFNEVVVTAVKNQEQAAELMEKLLAVAQPDAVYGEPVTVGEHTVITASEVSVSIDLLPNKEPSTIMGISSIQGDAHDYRFDRV